MGGDFNIPLAANAKSVREFDEGLTRVSFGFESVDDCYSKSSSSDSIRNVSMPLLCIQAENDPIAPSRGIPREDIKVYNETSKPSNSRSMDSSSQTTASAAAFTSGGNGTMIRPSNDASPMESSATTTAAAAGIPTDDPKQNLTQVINSIQKTLGILHQLYLNVSSFNVASQLPLLQRMNNLVLELDNMTKLAKNCNIQVPMDVLNLIDEGKNPDKFTQDMLNDCIAKNQITKGKTDSFKALRRHLLEELDQTFPDEVEAYREIRTSSAAESKRLEQALRSLPNGDVKVKAET